MLSAPNFKVRLLLAVLLIAIVCCCCCLLICQINHLFWLLPVWEWHLYCFFLSLNPFWCRELCASWVHHHVRQLACVLLASSTMSVHPGNVLLCNLAVVVVVHCLCCVLWLEELSEWVCVYVLLGSQLGASPALPLLSAPVCACVLTELPLFAFHQR